jgi:hypothetical protein
MGKALERMFPQCVQCASEGSSRASSRTAVQGVSDQSIVKMCIDEVVETAQPFVYWHKM